MYKNRNKILDFRFPHPFYKHLILIDAEPC